MKILISDIEIISLKTIDKNNDTLCLNIVGGFEINIETAKYPCLTIGEHKGKFCLYIVG